MIWSLHGTYGKIIFNNKHYTAHRLAYFFVYGFKDCIIRHKCDNPLCCNPLHLEQGTDKDNAQDCTCRNRHFSRKSKFSKKDVDKMRELHNNGNTQMEISKIYHTSDGTICKLLQGKVGLKTS